MRTLRAIAVTALAAALAAGCGTSPPSQAPATQAPAAGAPLLATAVVSGSSAWAVVVMGGSAASHNNFWQLFERPVGSAQWKLVTPPGTADNGGLVLAPASGQSVITAFRPSQYLTYTPLAGSRDGGQAWTSAGPLDAALANVPDALAAAPDGDSLLAVTVSGTAETAAFPYAAWRTLTTLRTLAATTAGRRCMLTDVTAAAYAPSGTPLLAGTCARAGIAGILADVSGTWEAAGPVLPASLAGRHVTVLRLATVGTQTVAVLLDGSGHATSLLAAWSADAGAHWALSPLLDLGSAAPASVSFGPAGTAAAITTAGLAALISPAGDWHVLPAAPPGTATLVIGVGGETDALSVSRGTLTVWQLPAGGAIWTQTQVIKVPIQYGSSS